MRKSELLTILTGLTELKKRVPAIPYSEHHSEIIRSLNEEAANFLKECENLFLNQQAANSPFTI